MADPLKVYNLDQVGVIVDTNPVLNPPNSFTKTQNASDDPLGEKGSVRKRPGLKKFTTVAGAGSVLGGVGVPIDLGSAGPIFANPFSNTDVKLVPPTVSIFNTNPIGPTFDDNGWHFPFDWYLDFGEPSFFLTVDPENVDDLSFPDDFDLTDVDSSDNFASSSINLPTLAPVNFLGNTSATGWYVSIDDALASHLTYPSLLFNNANVLYPGLGFRSMTGVTYHADSGAITISLGGKSAVSLSNVIYFAANYPTPALGIYNGLTNTTIQGIPGIGSVAQLNINSLLAANGKIYITVLSSGTTASSTGVGRVYSYDPILNQMQQVGSTFPIDQVPYSMTWAYGRLWVGTASESASSRLYWMRPGLDTDFTLDKTFAAGEGICSGLATFQGRIYAGVLNRTLAGSALLYVRATDGTFTTSDSGTIDTNAGHLSARGYLNLTVWPPEGSPVTSPTPTLYANRNGCTEDTWPNLGIRKLDPTLLTWSTVYTPSAGGGSGEIIGLYAINSSNQIVPILTVANGVGVSNSSNGTAWTDRSSNLTITATASFPTLFLTV